jgi:hypothetical protein
MSVIALIFVQVDGWRAGGSLCMYAKNLKEFVKPLLHKYEPQQPARKRIPPHIKVTVCSRSYH